jgi:hypothetical protein
MVYNIADSCTVKPKLFNTFHFIAGRRIWLQFLDFDFGSQHKNDRDIQLGEQASSEAVLEINLGAGDRPFQPFTLPGHLTDGAYLSEGERLRVRLRTADKPRGIGFKAVYRTGKLTLIYHNSKFYGKQRVVTYEN